MLRTCLCCPLLLSKTCFYLPRSGVLSIKNSIKLVFLRFTLWRQNIKFLSSTATNGIIGYLANLVYNWTRYIFCCDFEMVFILQPPFIEVFILLSNDLIPNLWTAFPTKSAAVATQFFGCSVVLLKLVTRFLSLMIQVIFIN